VANVKFVIFFLDYLGAIRSDLNYDPNIGFYTPLENTFLNSQNNTFISNLPKSSQHQSGNNKKHNENLLSVF